MKNPRRLSRGMRESGFAEDKMSRKAQPWDKRNAFPIAIGKAKTQPRGGWAIIKFWHKKCFLHDSICIKQKKPWFLKAFYCGLDGTRTYFADSWSLIFYTQAFGSALLMLPYHLPCFVLLWSPRVPVLVSWMTLSLNLITRGQIIWNCFLLLSYVPLYPQSFACRYFCGQ